MTLIGKVLAGRYEIIEEIGSGGMAVVYKAKCQLLNRFVAVKVLRPDLQNDEEFVRRFNVEAQAAASLTHPNIVSIYDVGNENGLHYIVMEYIEGKTLKEYIEEKHILPWREAVDYTIQIAKGLERAHKNAIIHRDVKPHNIIMTNDGVMKVTDFGIARANIQSTVTCEDNAIGSVHYISPEQARGGYTDERSDIYSLGVVLYEMITGTVPFDSERPVAVAIMHLQDKPVMPREYNISIPLALEKAVLKAMSKEISARQKDVSELISELTMVLNDPTRVPADVSDEKTNTAGMDETHIMPAVNPEDLEIKNGTEKDNRQSDFKSENNQEEEESVPARKKSNPEEIDKRKEKKVIVAAIVCAVAVILLISFAFMSITGMSSLFKNDEYVEIPYIVGMNYDQAVEMYVMSADANDGYEFNIIKGKTVESVEEEGTILAQNPKGRSKVKKKDVIIINVEISEGENEVRLKNYTKYQDAREVEIAVREIGLETEFIEEFSDDIPKDSIIRQEPQSGTYVKKGDIITFYVSKGPEEVETVGDNTETEEDTPANNQATEGHNLSGNNSATEGPKPIVNNQSTNNKPVVNENIQSTESNNSNNTENKKPNGNSLLINEAPVTNNSEPEVRKKSTMLTLYGPKTKESALVQVNVNGKTVYSKTIQKDQSDVVKLEGTSDSVEVEILHDGISQQKATVTLN